MGVLPGFKNEQVTTWGLLRGLFDLRKMRQWFPAVYTIEELRNTRYLLAKIVIISDAGKIGMLWRDDTDTTSADDGQDVICTADDVPVRYKRRSIFRKYTPLSGTDTTMEVGSMTWDANKLYLKTGASTIEEVPLKLLREGALVASTTLSTSTGDAGYWAKIATITATGNVSEVNALLAFNDRLSSVTQKGSGLIRIFGRRNAVEWEYSATVSGGLGTRVLQAVKLTKVSENTFDVWVQKVSAWSVLYFYLISWQQNSLVSYQWYTGAALQASAPVGDAAKDVLAIPDTATGSCTTATRPAALHLWPGYSVFDTTLGKPIWYTGTGWRDAAGVAV